MHGKFNFGNLANFVANFVQMKFQEMGLGDGAQERPQAQQEKAAPTAKKELGPLPELSGTPIRASNRGRHRSGA